MNLNKYILIPLLIFSSACSSDMQVKTSDAEIMARQEVDMIHSLLAYAVVYKDWQTEGLANPRGHNIGSVLINPEDKPVFWARNANAITNNGSQHGEVRLIHNYLNCSDDKYLSGYTVYTTLEPCAMCTGMMSLTKLTRSVYGQKDPGYGDALERLAYDSSGYKVGYKPYPRLFISVQSKTNYAKELNRRFSEAGYNNITRFLRSDSAKAVFERAAEDLITMQPDRLETSEGVKALEYAQKFLRDVSNSYVDMSLIKCDS